jgi:hypothetical protein
MREWKLWAKGTFNMGYAKDFSTVVPTLQSLNLDSGTDTWGDGSSSPTCGAAASASDDTWGPSSLITPKLVRGGKGAARSSRSTCTAHLRIPDVEGPPRDQPLPRDPQPLDS